MELAGVLECEPQPGHSLSLFGQFSSRIRDASLGVARSRARNRVLESERPDSPVGTTMHLLCCHALSIFPLSFSPILFRIPGCHACGARRSSTSASREAPFEGAGSASATQRPPPLCSGTCVCVCALMCAQVWKVTCERTFACAHARPRTCLRVEAVGDYHLAVGS